MRFGGKADVKGFLIRMSNSIGRHKPNRALEDCKIASDDGKHATEDDEKELEVENMAKSFINEDQLRDFDPGMGTANLQVLGRTNDGALDIGFHWQESDGSETSQARHLCLFHLLAA